MGSSPVKEEFGHDGPNNIRAKGFNDEKVFCFSVLR